MNSYCNTTLLLTPLLASTSRFFNTTFLLLIAFVWNRTFLSSSLPGRVSHIEKVTRTPLAVSLCHPPPQPEPYVTNFRLKWAHEGNNLESSWKTPLSSPFVGQAKQCVFLSPSFPWVTPTVHPATSLSNKDLNFSLKFGVRSSTKSFSNGILLTLFLLICFVSLFVGSVAWGRADGNERKESR